MNFDFEGYRDADGMIDLVEAFNGVYPWLTNTGLAERQLERIMELTPIRSRQAAAIAIVMAYSSIEDD